MLIQAFFPSSSTAALRQAGGRLSLIDALKAVGSQMIVLHHLAFYGPMSDWTMDLLPALMSWLSQDARMAVQVFLVVGGFLAARSLAPAMLLQPHSEVPRLIWQRYVRIVGPFVVAVMLTMVCTELARLGMAHDSLSPQPSLPDSIWQFASHLVLLHGVLGFESLTAGAWYVAIDFQLYVLLLAMLWMAKHSQRPRLMATLWVSFGVLVSLFFFNLDPAWDVWAVYFLGSYGLGALTYWATRVGPGVTARHRWAWGVLGLVVVLALWLDFRERILVAVCLAALLGLGQWTGGMQRWFRNRFLAYMSQISYSVFLLNFPVALLVNAWFTHYMPAHAWWQSLGVLVAWLVCNLAGAAFYHGVEQRLARVGTATPRWAAVQS